jgi:hypothetical protein
MKQRNAVSFIDRIGTFILKEGIFPQGQQLTWRSKGRIFPSETPGFNGELAIICSQQR